MNNLLITTFVRCLNNETAKRYALKLGISFSNEEIKLFLPYLKENITTLINLPIPSKKIHQDLLNKTPTDSLNKFILLINKLGYN